MVSLSAKRSGFTLIEIVVAMAIIAILALVATAPIMNYVKNARVSSAKSTLRVLEGAITIYESHTAQLPSRLNDLVKKPADERAAKRWQQGSYLKGKEVPLDPWGNKYQYKLTPQNPDHKYELYSYGPNGKGGPKEEIISVWDL